MTSGRAWSLVGGACLVLLASLVWAMLQLAWHRARHTDVLPLPFSAPAANNDLAAQINLDAITALSPFGTPASDGLQEQKGAGSELLNIALRGVLLDPDPTQSRAFVQVNSSIDVYRVGELVQGAAIVSVQIESITVRVGQELVTMGFNGVEGGSDMQSRKTAGVAKNTTNGPFARLAASIVPGHGSIDLQEGPPPETKDDYINLWRDRIGRNPQAAMDAVGVELVENGYRVKPRPNIGVTLAGLRPGDVVTSLNGQSIGDFKKDRELYDAVAAAGIARLEVVRDGKSLLMTFPLK